MGTCYNRAIKFEVRISMAKNTGNARIPVKWVRDRAKAAYVKEDTCFVCGTDQDLELHHTTSITLLLNDWAERKGYDISTDDGILAVRDEFIAEHHDEIYNQVYTLCNKHHVALHGVYGKSPSKLSAPKQVRWLNLQKQKYTGGGNKEDIPKSSYGSFFSEFI